MYRNKQAGITLIGYTNTFTDILFFISRPGYIITLSCIQNRIAVCLQTCTDILYKGKCNILFIQLFKGTSRIIAAMSGIKNNNGCLCLFTE